MANNRTPLTGKPLLQPEPPPRRMYSLFDRNRSCLEHQVAYTGSIPWAGVLRCQLCLTTWDPDTGHVLEVPSHGTHAAKARHPQIANSRNGTE